MQNSQMCTRIIQNKAVFIQILNCKYLFTGVGGMAQAAPGGTAVVGAGQQFL
jgi:hypothetical protein